MPWGRSGAVGIDIDGGHEEGILAMMLVFGK